MGLELPTVPSPVPASNASGAYRSAVARVQLDELHGLDYVKAQLYGIDAVVGAGAGAAGGSGGKAAQGGGGSGGASEGAVSSRPPLR